MRDALRDIDTCCYDGDPVKQIARAALNDSSTEGDARA
ncbi:hypothetical protein APY04_0775 [Hyphomicrobium sulfonivorans]|uniref:Uncharacterized protein n=2 Tax=Hyphomicrobium sulfonivorans TaxID=121290 RepID=A0A109BKX2_HYPSL|nr:hypothetical protein APY04_0775 [Hyphomicrobium sulfonivorans]